MFLPTLPRVPLPLPLLPLPRVFRTVSEWTDAHCFLEGDWPLYCGCERPLGRVVVVDFLGLPLPLGAFVILASPQLFELSLAPLGFFLMELVFFAFCGETFSFAMLRTITFEVRFEDRVTRFVAISESFLVSDSLELDMVTSCTYLTQ